LDINSHFLILNTAIGCDRPSERDLQRHVIPEVAVQWRKIGVELLDGSTKVLDNIEHNHPKVVRTATRHNCCSVFAVALE